MSVRRNRWRRLPACESCLAGGESGPIGDEERMDEMFGGTSIMRTKTQFTSVRSRHAFTIIELLVCLGILTVLMGLIVPAVGNARNTARRIECANNLRNLAFGLIGNMESRRHFPPSRMQGPSGMSSEDSRTRSTWVTAILPWIDQSRVYDRLEFDKAMEVEPNLSLAESHIPTLVCPSDISASDKGDLSFGVNGGIVTMTERGGIFGFVDVEERDFDLNGDGKLRYTVRDRMPEANEFRMVNATSLFDSHRLTNGRPGSYMRHPDSSHDRGRSPATIDDGMSNTLMIGDHVRAGFDPREENMNWATGNLRRLVVSINPEICRNTSCVEGDVDLMKANGGTRRINAGRARAEGEAPWLNSFHDGGVNVAFADGRVQFMSENIDGVVLFNLFTPQGEQLRNTPLANSDLSRSF